MFLQTLFTALLLAGSATAGGLVRRPGRKMLDGLVTGPSPGHDDGSSSTWQAEATEPGAPPHHDDNPVEPGSGADAVNENGADVVAEGTESHSETELDLHYSEPTSAPVDSEHQQQGAGTAPGSVDTSKKGFAANGYAFLADAFQQGAIQIVPNRGGENPCHSNSPSSTFFGQRYPGFFGGCLETQKNGG